jgi:hypothetical protein
MRVGYVPESLPSAGLQEAKRLLPRRAEERRAARARGAAGVPAELDDIDRGLRRVVFCDDGGLLAWAAARGLVRELGARIFEVVPAERDAAVQANIISILMRCAGR